MKVVINASQYQNKDLERESEEKEIVVEIGEELSEDYVWVTVGGNSYTVKISDLLSVTKLL